MQLLLTTDRVVINLAPDDAVGAFDAYTDCTVVTCYGNLPNDYSGGKYMFTNKWVKNPNYTGE